MFDLTDKQMIRITENDVESEQNGEVSCNA